MYFFYLIPEKLYSHCTVSIGRENIHYIAFYTKCSSRKLIQRSGIECIYQFVKELCSGNFRIKFQFYQRFIEFCRVSNPINTRNRGYYQHISPARKQACRSRKPEFFYLLIDTQILFYVSPCAGNIRFGLVVVVITDKILHSVLREKLFELHKKLRSQSFIMSQNQSRSLDFIDHISDGESLSRACYSEQCLVFFAVF